MHFFYSSVRFRLALRSGLLLAPAGAALAQAPVITTATPMANALAATRTGPVTVSFSQPLTAASAGALQVFSNQRGGRRTAAAPATVSGSTLNFAPTAYPFMPGETVQYTVTTAAAGLGGALGRARVGQFTVAGGTGTGIFSLGSAPTVGGFANGGAMGDVDGDGDLDLLVATQSTTVSVRLNDGRGHFAGNTEVAVLTGTSLLLGDVDGDGDLDMVNSSPYRISVHLNDGAGVFSDSRQIPLVSSSSAANDAALGDVDGDGDLDLLFTRPGGPTNIAVRLNDGTGTFSGTREVEAGSAHSILLGDVDGDGDLDVLATGAANTVIIRLNDGSGNFTGTQQVATGTAYHITAGDVDGDGDLDLLAPNLSLNTVSVRLNDGNGNFSGTQEVSVGPHPVSVAAIDVDGDGDLDLATTNGLGSSTLSVRINNGSGLFSGSQDIAVGNFADQVFAGDADGDGDLDLVTNNSPGRSVSIMLNGSTALATARGYSSTGVSLWPNPSHGSSMLSGLAPHAPVQVLDPLGRVLLAITSEADGTARLVLPEKLSAGLYLVCGGGQVRRLVVE
ncbi:hypothetical protein GCM10028824_31360 [Hymenobacter segetis]|uniref:Ig-like domain-containing protein n=1 Tax=Hymenobacter segetis TaxID=2025509 RepID=A0ABU9LQG0_9BACT